MLEVNDLLAKVDFGDGTVREALVAAPEELSMGDVVLVHAGTIISKLSREEFMESFRYYRDIAVQIAVQAGVPEKRARREVNRSLKGLLDRKVKG